jgi:hypothetical protein
MNKGESGVEIKKIKTMISVPSFCMSIAAAIPPANHELAPQ